MRQRQPGQISWEAVVAILSCLVSAMTLVKAAAWPFMVNEHLNRIDERLLGIEKVLKGSK